MGEKTEASKIILLNRIILSVCAILITLSSL